MCLTQVELNSTCADTICRPELELHVSYTGYVDHMSITCLTLVNTRTTPVYLNERFNIPFNITVINNGVEDGFAFKVMIKLPYRGIIKLTEVLLLLPAAGMVDDCKHILKWMQCLGNLSPPLHTHTQLHICTHT